MWDIVIRKADYIPEISNEWVTMAAPVPGGQSRFLAGTRRLVY